MSALAAVLEYIGQRDLAPKRFLLRSWKHTFYGRCGLQSVLTISKTDSCLTFWMLSRPCAFWIDCIHTCRCQAAL